MVDVRRRLKHDVPVAWDHDLAVLNRVQRPVAQVVNVQVKFWVLDALDGVTMLGRVYVDLNEIVR